MPRESDFMPNPDAPKTMTFKSPKELSKWLQANHATGIPGTVYLILSTSGPDFPLRKVRFVCELKAM